MQVFEEISELVSGKLKLYQTLAKMVKLEARLAGLSIFPMMMTLAILIVFCLSFWVSSLILLGYLLYQVFHSFLIAIVLVVILNVVSVALAIRALISNIKNLSFARTRKYLLHQHGKDNNEPQEKKNNQTTQ